MMALSVFGIYLKQSQIQSAGEHAGSVIGVDITPDGRKAVSLGVEGTIRLWGAEKVRMLEGT